jgi:hypothetical protein
MNHLRRAAMQLLVDDVSGESLEDVLQSADLHAERSDLIDHAPQIRIYGAQVIKRQASIETQAVCSFTTFDH